MRIDPVTRDHLSGSSFSSGFGFRLAADALPPRGRVTALVAAVTGRSVIHLGCVDHPVLVAEKRRSGLWLHGRLAAAARRCMGVDVNAEGVRLLREQLGVPDVYAADLTMGPIAEMEGEVWDLLLVPEVLEHVDDPVDFLRGVRRSVAGYVDTMILTVPNALRLDNFSAALRNREWVNSDHRHWYTPYTVAKVATQAGLVPESVEMCYGSERSGRWWKRLLERHRPLLRESIVLTASVGSR